jgi:hypothetical protein
MNEQLNILNIDVLDSLGLRVAESASCTLGTGYFPGVKRLERGADHPGCEWVRVVPFPPPCVNRGMSWGDIYLYLSQGIFGISRFGGFYGYDM